jgi:hypothetical protein
MSSRDREFEKILINHHFENDESVLRGELAREKSTSCYSLPPDWTDFEKLISIDLALNLQKRESEVFDLYMNLFKLGKEKENQSTN